MKTRKQTAPAPTTLVDSAMVRPWLRVPDKLVEIQDFFQQGATELPFNSVLRGRFPVPPADLTERAQAFIAAGGPQAAGVAETLRVIGLLDGIEKASNNFVALIRRARLALSQQIVDVLDAS